MHHELSAVLNGLQGEGSHYSAASFLPQQAECLGWKVGDESPWWSIYTK